MKNALRSAILAASVATCATNLSAQDAAGTWVQLIPVGTFSGRDGRGPWHTDDAEHLQAIVEASRQLAGTQDIVVDFDHQSIFSATPGVGGKAPAAGWIKELEARSDGVWGRVEWTTTAQSQIRNGEYKYISPVFLFSKSTGKVLAIRLAGLTNMPNLDLAAVEASSLIVTTENQEEPMKRILAALGLAEGTSEDGVIAAINAMQTSSTNLALAAGLTRDAKSEDVLAAINSMAGDLKKIRSAAKLQDTASADDVVTAINSVQTAAVDPAQYVPITAVVELQKTVTGLQTHIKTGDAEIAVNSAIISGRLSPALRDWGVALHSSDPAGFKTFVDNAPVLTATQRVDPNLKPAAAALGDTDMAVMSQMGISKEDMLASRQQEAS